MLRRPPLWSGCCLLLLAAISYGQTRPASAEDTDAALQNAATKALGRRAGTIIVLDAQTGRVRAVANPRLAFEQSRPPGSTLKPFVALAALRAGLLKPASKLRCATPYEQGDYQANCVHPRGLAHLSTQQALAHSCNYFFGKLGEEFKPGQVRQALSQFGLGGSWPRGEWQARYAIGDSQNIRVVPAQLAAAYAALANGGKLYAVQRGQAVGFTPRLRANIALTDAQRKILLSGMRGAVTYGTARSSGLNSLPVYVFGKTGTMIDEDGRGEQGWFVGLAAQSQALPAAAQVRLVVLAYLSGAKGGECAAMSESVFGEWAKALGGNAESQKSKIKSRKSKVESQKSKLRSAPVVNPETLQGHAPAIRNPQSAFRNQEVRVQVNGETRALPLEEYVAGVLATEASLEDEPEALKAQAVTTRTYALKHLRRHARAGYDFCTLTHCQRFAVVKNMRPSVLQAVRNTNGQVLRDKGGKLIEAYYSASCGGMSADVKDLWGVAPKNYLRGQRDEACDKGPHASWEDVIVADKLVAALHRDPRSDVGARLDAITITPDATGRAEFVILQGTRRRALRGWDFKLIVGRGLGWKYLKSSRFTVSRQGADFVFRGRGFGHGLGLCQEGAHVRAQRGASYRKILAHYFPTTIIKKG